MPQQPQASPTPVPKKKVRVPRVVNGVEQMVEIEVDDVGGPGWGPNDKHAILNKRYTRVDGPLKVAVGLTLDTVTVKVLESEPRFLSVTLTVTVRIAGPSS